MTIRAFTALWSKSTVVAATLLLATGLLSNASLALTLNVVDGDGNPVSGGFYWTLQEDNTVPVLPPPRGSLGIPGATDSLAFGFHSAHRPVLKTGESNTDSATIDLSAADLPALPHRPPMGPGGTLSPPLRYFISVLPKSGHAMSGIGVTEFQNSATLTLTVNKHPIPTAQISVFAFADTDGIDGQWSANEPGFPGVEILLFDAAGMHGWSGQVLVDAFGNALGTEYDANGNVTKYGDGTVKTDANGYAVIKNLAPGKYDVQITPPVAAPPGTVGCTPNDPNPTPGCEVTKWVQTTTLEGGLAQEAFVKSNEPIFFSEFGPTSTHVSFGFVPETMNEIPAGGGGTISGRIVNLHTSRPPDFTFYSGDPRPNCFVGLNNAATGGGQGIFVTPCDGDSKFSITGVPDGVYQLAIWDRYLTDVFAFHNVTVSNGVSDLVNQDVPVFQWNSRVFHNQYLDLNENGFPDDGEPGIVEQAATLRRRDGSVYFSMPSDLNGDSPMEEVFPFFNWLVAEPDFARFKSTGLTYVVDDGGPVNADQGWTYPSFDMSTPQAQDCPALDQNGNCLATNPNTGNNLVTTLTGETLTFGLQSFLGHTNRMFWGHAPYQLGQNGGISGSVYYATTRAEEDPRYAANEEWEPGIPRAQVALYGDANSDGIVDDLNNSGSIEYADVDNYPLGWQDGGTKGPEDVDHNGDGIFDMGDSIQVVHADSWDDNLPTGCQGTPYTFNGVTFDCFDGLRNFNQIRPAVYDGAYAFVGIEVGTFPNEPLKQAYEAAPDPQDGRVYLPAGDYIIESAAPPGYQIAKEEDINVAYGDAYQPTPTPALLPPECVGDMHTVPPTTTLFPDMDAPFANQQRPLCNRLKIHVGTGINAAASFPYFTPAPVATHVTGIILNDLSNEFDPKAPAFGEKFAPPWLPVSFKDWTGREVARVYADEWGVYNALVPSSYTVNVPMPSGVSPHVMQVCMNDSGPIRDRRGNLIPDPFYNPQYSQFCYTFPFMPGLTTYLDTPVLPIAAFANNRGFPVDCECTNGTPEIYSVDSNRGGPVVGINSGDTVTITSRGTLAVPNPNYDYTLASTKTVERDYGFGTTAGTVTLTDITNPSNVITFSSPPGWADDQITLTGVNIPRGDYQLMVTRGDNGKTTKVGVTVTALDTDQINGTSGTRYNVRHVSSTIQAAIDAANPGDLVLVPPGTYSEMVLMWKPVKLQGYGAYATYIDAANRPTNKLAETRQKIVELTDGNCANGEVDLVQGKTPNDPNLLLDVLEPPNLTTEEGAGILVVSKDVNTAPACPGTSFEELTSANYRGARIDGVTVSGSSIGGGIVVNAYVKGQQGTGLGFRITNNHVSGNQGSQGGGIRLGNATVTESSENNFVTIGHNQVDQNGSADNPGGGVALYSGSNGYQVTDNFICGNFASGHGGGVMHQGLSQLVQAGQPTIGGLIARNDIVFNQSFAQDSPAQGGGIYVGGAVLGALTDGAGPVTIDDNLIQGNSANAGDGGGIAADQVNGTDVGPFGDTSNAFPLRIVNNRIVNNVAALAGGGISLQDAVNVEIVNNTVAHNDSTATAALAFTATDPNASVPQAAGIVTREHTAALKTVITDPAAQFSSPLLVNNIVWQNRSYHFSLTSPTVFGLSYDGYDDIGVVSSNASHCLTLQYSVLTDTGEAELCGASNNNTPNNPVFAGAYFNAARGQTVVQTEPTTIFDTAIAFDEGGNMIDVSYGPLSLDPANDGTIDGDYHIQSGSSAINAGDNGSNTGATVPATDFEGQGRSGAVDIGADELGTPTLNAAPAQVTTASTTTRTRTRTRR